MKRIFVIGVIIMLVVIMSVFLYRIYDFADGFVNKHDISYYLVNETKDTVFIKYENTPDRRADDSVMRSMGYKIDNMGYPLPPSDSLNYLTLSTTSTLHFKSFFTYSRFFKPRYKYIYIKYRSHEYPINIENQKPYTCSSKEDEIKFILHINNLILK